MSNRTLYFIILFVAAITTTRLFTTAIEHNFWREFYVSEVQVLVTASVLAVVLRKRA